RRAILQRRLLRNLEIPPDERRERPASLPDRVTLREQEEDQPREPHAAHRRHVLSLFLFVHQTPCIAHDPRRAFRGATMPSRAIRRCRCVRLTRKARAAAETEPCSARARAMYSRSISRDCTAPFSTSRLSVYTPDSVPQ